MTDEEQLAGLFSQLEDIEEPQVNDVTKASSPALALALKEIDAELARQKELLGDPTTQEARDLHSYRGAIVVELKRRGH